MTTCIYTKGFQLASLAFSHATLLHQHGGLFSMCEHHRPADFSVLASNYLTLLARQRQRQSRG